MQGPKIILTSEKDAVKLKDFFVLRAYPLYFQEIDIGFDHPENELYFQKIIHRKIFSHKLV